MSSIRRQRRRKRILKGILITAAVLAAVVLIGFVLMKKVFVIREMDVEGCVYAQEEEVLAAVQSGDYSENSILLFLQLMFGEQPDAAFVDSVRVSFVSPWQVTLNVTEVTVYGFVYDEDTGIYTYFDADGTVNAISATAVPDTMEVDGTVSGDATKGSELSLIPAGSLDYVLEVFSLISSYDLNVYIVHLDTRGNVYFTTSGITIQLGTDGNTAEKFENLSAILPQLEGKTGTLDLSVFEETGDDIIFTEE